MLTESPKLQLIGTTIVGEEKNTNKIGIRVCQQDPRKVGEADSP